MVTCGNPTCKNVFEIKEQYAYLGGDYYCSSKCYDILFLPCLECGEKNMTAKNNKDRHNEQLCDKCRDKKYGWSTVTLIFS